MKKKTSITLGVISLTIFTIMLIVAASGPSSSSAQTSITAGLTLPNRNIYALTTDQALYILRPGASQYQRLGRINTPAGDNIIEIDFRPSNNKLYAYSDFGRLYTVDLSSTNFGATTLVTTTNPRLTTGFGGAVLDFNPVIDAIRLIGQNDQNIAVTSSGGDLNTTVVQTKLAYVQGDPNFGQDPEITAGAYSNNVAGATTTLFYMIDHDKDTLVTIQDKNATGSSNTGGGRLQTVGPLVDSTGNRLNMSPLTTMDIVTIGGVNTIVGQTTRLLFTINLSQVNPNLPVGTLQKVVVARGNAGTQLAVGAPQLSGGIRGLAVSTQ